jgi:hypothetical protein
MISRRGVAVLAAVGLASGALVVAHRRLRAELKRERVLRAAAEAKADVAAAVTVNLQKEMQAMKNSDDSTEKASRFSAIPADFLLSYGGLDDFEKGLTALVGPPVANAALLEKAVHDEHKNDKAFRMWSNKFKKEYEVNPVLEYNYCQGPARESGHEQYRQAIQPDIDLNRDTGQDGRTVEAFMQNYGSWNSSR